MWVVLVLLHLLAELDVFVEIVLASQHGYAVQTMVMWSFGAVQSTFMDCVL